ncbi:MAG TPA: FtsX-like permease family protein [Flavisolibacter sp.]|nr:FtsX-like permease family protein [Flavisolibacter sp.]
MNFLFAWRYFKAKKTTNAINIISWISIVAIVIGTAALILVLSVFNGFEGLVKSLYTSFYPDVKISPASGKQLVLTPEQLQKIKSVKGVKAVSLFVEEKALLQNKADDTDSADFQSIIYLKGVDSNYTSVTTVAENLIGNVPFNTGTEDQPLLVLGAGVENAVHVRSESNIRPLAVYMPRKGAVSLDDPLQSLSAEAVNTSGTFVIQQDFDNKYAITNLAFIKRMLVMDENTFSGAEIAVTNGTKADDVRDQIKALLGKNYVIQNRFEQNASLFSVMRIEKWIIYAILSLILIVAAFNMVGALTMLVLEKKQDISVLHALGASRGFIQKIFLSEGLLLAIIGGGAGMLLAFIIGILQIKLHLVPLEGSTFLIDYFPVKMVLSDFLLVALTVLIIALIASWLPARKAALQQFVLREE